MPNYVGPGPLRFREIAGTFSDDPNWFDVAVAPPGEALTIAVPLGVGRMTFAFAFYGADKLRRSGGTATLRPFFVVPGAAYGEADVVDARGVVHPIDDEADTYDLTDTYDVTVSPGTRVGLRLSGITAPGDAVRLRIAAIGSAT